MSQLAPPMLDSKTESENRLLFGAPTWGRTGGIALLALLTAIGTFLAVRQNYRAAAPALTREISFHVSGMECAMCAVELEEAIGKVPGVKDVDVDFESGKASVKIDAKSSTTLGMLRDAVSTTKCKAELTEAEGCGAPVESH